MTVRLTSIAARLCSRAVADQILRPGTAAYPYGVTTSLQHLPVLVGKDSGLFAKYGLNVEPIHIRGGALITTMIMSGTVQFSGAGAESVVSARIEGGDVALIACPADSDAVYFVARPEIKTAANLKGKNSAVTRLGSTTHFYLRAALRSLGLDPEKDMTILQLGGGPEIVAAMRGGRVAAAALPYRNTFSLIQSGWPLLVDMSTPNFVYPSSCVATTRAFIKSNPAVVERFLKAYIESTWLIKKDSALAEQVIKKWHRETDWRIHQENRGSIRAHFQADTVHFGSGIGDRLEGNFREPARIKRVFRKTGTVSRSRSARKTRQGRLDRSRGNSLSLSPLSPLLCLPF